MASFSCFSQSVPQQERPRELVPETCKLTSLCRARRLGAPNQEAQRPQALQLHQQRPPLLHRKDRLNQHLKRPLMSAGRRKTTISAIKTRNPSCRTPQPMPLMGTVAHQVQSSRSASKSSSMVSSALCRVELWHKGSPCTWLTCQVWRAKRFATVPRPCWEWPKTCKSKWSIRAC